MKPHIRLSRYWQTCKSQDSDFSLEHKWACSTPGDRVAFTGFGRTPKESYEEWQHKVTR